MPTAPEPFPGPLSDYQLCSMNNPVGRRGIWFRAPDSHDQIEIRAGREGDDHYLILKAGQILTHSDIYYLDMALSVGSWMIEMQKEEDGG